MAGRDSAYILGVSAFMSQKYRQLAGLSGAPAATVIDRPTPCAGCGYELQGLTRGGACPECGSAIPLPGTGPARVDPLLALDEDERSRVRLGARLGAIGLLIVAVEPVASLVLGVLVVVGGIGASDLIPVGVRSVRLLVCGLWVAAGFLAAPPALWRRRGQGRGGRLLGPATRLPILGLLASWGVGQAMMIFVAHDAANRVPGMPAAGWITLLGGIAAVLRFLGGLAAAAVLVVIAGAAEDAEVEPSADRLMAGAVVLPVLGFVIWVLPNTMPWFAVLLYMIVLLLPWAWFAWRAGMGMLGVARHLMWADRIGEQAAGRDERIAAQRAAYDASVRSRIRPVPGPARATRPKDAP